MTEIPGQRPDRVPIRAELAGTARGGGRLAKLLGLFPDGKAGGKVTINKDTDTSGTTLKVGFKGEIKEGGTAHRVLGRVASVGSGEKNINIQR